MTNKLLPNYTWINGLSYEFKIPMTLNGMKDVKIKTTTCGGKEVWARLGGNHQSYLPARLLMKDIIFGVMYKEEKEIDWYDSQQTLDSNDIDSFCFKGTAITSVDEYNKTYNPYTKYNRFQLETLINNRNVQVSLWRTVENYKNSGAWNEMCNIRLHKPDVVSHVSRLAMWKILTKNLSIKDFVIPNPAISLQLNTHKENGSETETFRFLFTNKITTKKQTLTEWIKQSPAPKPIESVEDWTDYIKAYEYALENEEELIEEDNPF